MAHHVICLDCIHDEGHRLKVILVNYLINRRLQWGKPDTMSLLTSEIVESSPVQSSAPSNNGHISTLPSPGYFTADMSPTLISIIQNDWPYSVPLDVEHTLIWTKLPILPPPSLVPPHISATLSEETLHKVTARLQQDGVWGFTGSSEPPPSPSLLPHSLGALNEWGVTLEKLIISPRGTAEEEEAVRMAGNEVAKFVKNRWKEVEWETAWFVNPPRLQSVKDLAHIHVFARKKGSQII